MRNPIELSPYAACSSVPKEIFISGDVDDELTYPTPEALSHCQRCFVRVECLTWALKYDEWGVWGGTSRYQRSQLKRIRSRQVCPSCAGRNVVTIRHHQVCLACGVSWLRQRVA